MSRPWLTVGCATGLIALLTGCGTLPSGVAQHTVVLGSTQESITVALPVIRGHLWWRTENQGWQRLSWKAPPATLPTPLRDTVAWTHDLSEGQWPGTPLPSTWAAWAGHVGSPSGWLVTNVPANGGPAHPVAIDVFLPEKAPYHGYGVLSVFWTEQRGHWLATVRNPEALPATTNLHTLWKRAQ